MGAFRFVVIPSVVNVNTSHGSSTKRRARTMMDYEDGWEDVGPSKMKARRLKQQAEAAKAAAAAVARGGVESKPYSAFDPSTWGQPQEKAKVETTSEPKKPQPKQPAPPPPPELEVVESGKRSTKPKKPKEASRADLAACCERLLLNSTGEGWMGVPELSMALATLMGFGSWNKKYKPVFGPFRSFLERCPEVKLVRVNGEDRAYLPAALKASALCATDSRTAAKTRDAPAAGLTIVLSRYAFGLLRASLIVACALHGCCALALPGPQATLCATPLCIADLPAPWRGGHSAPSLAPAAPPAEADCQPIAALSALSDRAQRGRISAACRWVEAQLIDRAGDPPSVMRRMRTWLDDDEFYGTRPWLIGAVDLTAAACLLVAPRTGALLAMLNASLMIATAAASLASGQLLVGLQALPALLLVRPATSAAVLIHHL